jgi:threonine/homoserine/homoserine lactone efflux protein
MEAVDTSFALVSAGTEALLLDVATSPEYYINAAGVLAAMLTFCVVLFAILGAVNHFPLLPAGLKIIGLCYCVWFFCTLMAPSVTADTAREVFLDDVAVLVEGIVGQRE